MGEIGEMLLGGLMLFGAVQISQASPAGAHVLPRTEIPAKQAACKPKWPSADLVCVA